MSNVDVTLTEYIVEIVENDNTSNVIVSGSNEYNIVISDASQLTAGHINDYENPHLTTKAQVGLSNVTNDAQLKISQFENTLTPSGSYLVPSSKAVADYVSVYSPIPSAQTLIGVLNNSTEVLNDINIASSIARDSEVSSAINNAISDLVHTNDARLSDARTPVAHTQAASTITDFDIEVANNTDVAANTSARHIHDNMQLLVSISGSNGIINDSNLPSTIVRTNDARLSDLRTPLSHGNESHSSTFITAAAVTYETLNANSDVGTTSGTLCAGNDARLSDSRTPVAHTHGNITNTGYLGSTANIPVITGTSGIIQAGSFGSAANTFCQGNDSRLSDARTPVSHAHGNITNTGYLGSTANIPLITGTSGIIQAGSFGSAANTFCQGNDSRLSDARTPVSHAHGNITNTGYLGSTANIPLITGTSGVIQAGSFGSAANTFCQGNDARLSDARTPVTHAHTYADMTSLVTAVTNDDTKIPSAGAIVDYVAGYLTELNIDGGSPSSVFTAGQIIDGGIL